MAPLTLEEYATADLRALVKQLTQSEKIDLLSGDGWWTTRAIPRLGIPAVKMSDGPNGVRGSSHFQPTPANCIPCETALGATFSTPLITSVGGLLAREAKAKGSSIILAPCVNIQRSPLNGRAFEGFSEDPFLSGTMAAAYTNGLQADGVAACIKHFVGNDMEYQRFSVSSEIAARPFREVYLKPFMLAEKLSKPWSLMTSYGRVNGLHCSDDKPLLQSLLRDEWGFDGMIMSDWTGTYSSDLAIEAGMDLEMPGPSRFRTQAQIKHLVGAGKIKMSDVDNRAYAVLQLAQRAVIADIETVRNNTAKETVHDTPEDRALNRQVASEAIVLLKNSLATLPLDVKKVKKIAVIGPNAKTRTVSGGGSAYITSLYAITPLEGIQAAVAGTGVEVVYAPGCYGHKYLPMLDGWITSETGETGWTARFYNEEISAGLAPIATMGLPGTRMRINDSKPAGLQDQFHLAISGYLVAQSTGPFEFGLSVVGRCKLFIDGQLVIDNGMETDQTPGGSFYGLGTIEETGLVDFVEGKTYHLTLEYTNIPKPAAVVPGATQPALMMAALRVGGAPKIADAQIAINEAIALAKDCDAVLCFTGSNMDWEAEGSDREGLQLPGLTDELVAKLLVERPDAVICNQSGSAFAFPWADQCNTLLQSWFGGNETGNAIADVVFGKVNPSGRMPLTFPKQIEDCTAHLNWQAENGKVYYGEGLFVGYKGYEETKRIPTAAFGEGLSYTTFEWSDMQVKMTAATSAEEIKATVDVLVTNTGSVDGADVIQVYVTDKVCSLRRPKKELQGFTKVFLKAGEGEVVSIPLDKISFSYYDDAQECWVAEKGEFEILVSKSSKAGDCVFKATVVLEETFCWTGL